MSELRFENETFVSEMYINSSDAYKNFVQKYSRLVSFLLCIMVNVLKAGLGGSVGCAVRLETRRSRVQPPPRSATFFRGD